MRADPLVVLGMRIVLMALILVVNVPTWAAINNPADSSTFPFKYEGDAASLFTLGNTGYTGSLSGYILTGDSPSPGLLDVSIDAGSATPGLVVYLSSPDWATNATQTNGWSWEASFRMKTGRFTVNIGDETDPHDILDILDNGQVFSRINGLLTTLSSTTDAQHVYRVAQAPNSTEYNVWIDGNLVGLYDAADTGIGTGGAHWWSDGSGSTQGEYELDFIRFTGGGFSPIGFDPGDPTRFIWSVDDLARWDESDSWDQPGPPNDTMITAVFGDVITSPRTVVVDGAYTVKGLEFDNANAYALAGLGGITLEADIGTAAIDVLASPAAGHQIQVALSLASDTVATTAPGTRLDINSTVVLNGNTFTISPGSTVNLNNGTADSSSGMLDNLGVLAAGGPIEGDLVNSPSGALAVAIGGTAPEDIRGFDISGSASLSGVIDVSLESFTPTPGDTFTVLTADDGITDLGLSITGAKGFSYAVTGNDLVLTYAANVPEPATLGLLFLGGCIFWMRRRRNSSMAGVVSAVTQCLLVVSFLSVSLPVWAVINNPANSSTFAYKYEGDAASLATFGNTGYAGGTTGYILTGDSPSPGILDVSIDGGSGTPGLIVYLQSPTWAANATNAAGWSWETSLRMKSGEFVVRIGDEADAHTVLTIGDDGTIGNFFTGTIATIPSTTDSQHVYRIAQSSGSNQYDLWVDNSYVSSFAGNPQLGSGGPHWWSDGSGSTSGEYELDYVRFDAGGYSPIGSVPDSTRLLWTPNSLGRWDDTANWNNSNSSPGVPNSNMTTAVFGRADISTRTVVVDGDYTVKAIEFDASNFNQYGIVGLGSVTLEADSGSSAITVLNSSPAGHEIQVAVNLASDTNVTVAPGALLNFNNLLNLGGNTLSIASGSQVNINNNIDSGTSGTVNNSGTIGGMGRVNGNLVNTSGVVSPGNSPGTLTVDGNYSQDAGSTLSIELASTSSHDVLNVLGSLTAGGTLNVTTLEGFMPALNDEFDILNFSSAGGSFMPLNLPSLAEGLSWSTSSLLTTGILKVVAGLPGDYNENGAVDAADYTVWRDIMTAGGTVLANDPTPGVVDETDFAYWREHFGETGGAGSAIALASVPEPTSMGCGLMALAGIVLYRRRLWLGSRRPEDQRH